MRTITKINVWKSNSNEVRVYVTFENEKEQGCWFYSGNNYNKKGTLTGMSEEEKKEAKNIMNRKAPGFLTNVYESEIKKYSNVIDAETLDIISRNKNTYSEHNNKSDISI